jgi:hypothetical protein
VAAPRWILLACAFALAACSAQPSPTPTPSPKPSDVRPAPDRPAWIRATLPAPPGAPGRPAILDAANCAGRWYVVGGVLSANGATRPAAWTSTDGRTWESVPFEPLPGSYYGPQDLISSVGCAGPKPAMIGAKPGGAHGIPRVSTWRLTGRRMVEVAAPFDTYGGDNAVNVAHMVGGPAGFLITGNRTAGAAIWLSPDGANFRLIDHGPGLAGDATHQTVARDAVAGPDGTWVIVGGSASKNAADQQPAVWRTTTGRRFTRDEVPFRPGYNELQRVIRLGDDIIAAGPRGEALGAWRRPAGEDWRSEGSFGRSTDGVRSLTVAGDRLIAASGPGLWTSADRGATWRPMIPPTGAGPTPVVAGGATALLVAGSGCVWLAVE